jgi:hypothetical protein
MSSSKFPFIPLASYKSVYTALLIGCDAQNDDASHALDFGCGSHDVLLSAMAGRIVTFEERRLSSGLRFDFSEIQINTLVGISTVHHDR